MAETEVRKQASPTNVVLDEFLRAVDADPLFSQQQRTKLRALLNGPKAPKATDVIAICSVEDDVQ